MNLRLIQRLTGTALAGALFAVVQGCGSSFVQSDSVDGGGSDATTSGDAASGDSGSSGDAGGGDASTSDASSVDSGASDAGAPDSGDDAGDGAACPTPHPMACGTILECPCMDGTTQVGGCSNGFTCPEACCGHGGST
jgi:hypothetical protein